MVEAGKSLEWPEDGMRDIGDRLRGQEMDSLTGDIFSSEE